MAKATEIEERKNIKIKAIQQTSVFFLHKKNFFHIFLWLFLSDLQKCEHLFRLLKQHKRMREMMLFFKVCGELLSDFMNETNKFKFPLQFVENLE